MSRRPALIVVLAAALITACGPSSQPAKMLSTTPTSSASTGSSPYSPAGSSEVRVGLAEWTITTDADRIVSGTVTLVVTNAGTAAHDLRVTGPDEAIAATAMLQPGERQETTFTAPTSAGATVLLWCTVPGHAQQGMRATLAVQ